MICEQMAAHGLIYYKQCGKLQTDAQVGVVGGLCMGGLISLLIVCVRIVYIQNKMKYLYKAMCFTNIYCLLAIIFLADR